MGKRPNGGARLYGEEPPFVGVGFQRKCRWAKRSKIRKKRERNIKNEKKEK